MKKLFLISLLCLSSVYWAWGGATNNIITWMIFMTDASGRRLEVPTDYSENDVLQHFSSVLKWNGQTVTIAAGDTDSQASFGLVKKPDGTGSLILLKITLQRFLGTIPLQADDPVNCLVKVSITTSDGYTKTEDVPRLKTGPTQNIDIDITH